MPKLTDARPQFFMVEDAVFDYQLTPYEGWVYMAILKHADRQTGVAFPGMARLAKLCKMSRKQVERCIDVLEQKGVITVERDTKPEKGEHRVRKPNHYTVVSLSKNSGGVQTHSPQGRDSESVGVGTPSLLNQNQEPESINSASDDAVTPPAKPKKERARNPIFDAVAYGSFDLLEVKDNEGGRIGKIVSWLNKQEGITAALVENFYAWYADETSDASAPRDVNKFSEWWQKFEQDGDGGNDPFKNLIILGGST